MAAPAQAPTSVATPPAADPAAAQGVDIRSRADARSREREGR
jgi:hypothetical protein